MTAVRGRMAAQPGVYYHVAPYRDWPKIRAEGLIPIFEESMGKQGHVWLFTNTEQAMRYKDSYTNPDVRPCIIVVRTDRAVPTESGIPGAYWVPGRVTKDEIYDVIRPDDLHHYAKTAALPLSAVISVAEETMLRGRLNGRKWHIPSSGLDRYPDGVWDPQFKEDTREVREFLVKVLRENGAQMASEVIRIYQSTYGMGGAIAATDGMNSITVRDNDVDTLTLLHECAHIINRTREGEGHDERFVQVAADLYRRYISPEAAEQFLRVVDLPRRNAKTAMPVKPERQGLCYQYALQFLKNCPDPNAQLVHGSINDGAVPHHAWVEFERDGQQMVHEPTYDEDFSAVFYLRNAHPEPQARYSKNEAMAAMLRHGHYGPWHEGSMASKTALEDTSDSVMIALVPPEEVIKPLVDLDETTEPADQMHLTLLYLGKKGDVGGFMGRERIYRACYDFAIHAGYRGLTGQVNGFGTFCNGDENVLWAAWDIPGIAEFRTHLVAKCRDHGVYLRNEDHGFTPHMTLAYSDSPFRSLPALPDNLPEKVIFKDIWIAWGDEWQPVMLP